MAWTVTRYRPTNPGLNSRGFDITAADPDVTGDPNSVFAHNCLWTPDSWTIVNTDGLASQYVGQYGALVNSTNVALTKIAGAGSAGSLRLTLQRLATRP